VGKLAAIVIAVVVMQVQLVEQRAKRGMRRVAAHDCGAGAWLLYQLSVAVSILYAGGTLALEARQTISSYLGFAFSCFRVTYSLHSLEGSANVVHE
jgi:hypothetical protein